MLLPEPIDDVDLEAAYAPPDRLDERPFVRVNMIASLDGAIAVQGRSGPLGGPADRGVFQVLRSLADVILVGAGTVRGEGYGPARMSADAQQRRTTRGQTPQPPIAVVTRSCHLDWTSPFFTVASVRPIVVTTDDAEEAACKRATAHAELITAGVGTVDLDHALVQLAAGGARSVLVEGGPRLNAELAAGGSSTSSASPSRPASSAATAPACSAAPSSTTSSTFAPSTCSKTTASTSCACDPTEKRGSDDHDR